MEIGDTSSEQLCESAGRSCKHSGLTFLSADSSVWLLCPEHNGTHWELCFEFFFLFPSFSLSLAYFLVSLVFYIEELLFGVFFQNSPEREEWCLTVHRCIDRRTSVSNRDLVSSDVFMSLPFLYFHQHNTMLPNAGINFSLNIIWRATLSKCHCGLMVPGMILSRPTFWFFHNTETQL